MQRVLFFGDDVVAAVADPSGLGLVGRLACAAFGVGVPVVAFNLGVPGETSVDVSRRWRKEAAPRVSLGEPWRPVFCFGANDTAGDERRTRVEAAASIQALQKVLARSLHGGLSPLIIGPPPIGDPDQRLRTTDLSRRFADACRQHSTPYQETAVPLLASESWTAEVETNANLLSAAAYHELTELIIAAGWLDRLRPLAQSAGTAGPR